MKILEWMLNESLVGFGVKYDLHDIVCQFNDREKRKIKPMIKDFFLHSHIDTNTSQKNFDEMTYSNMAS